MKDLPRGDRFVESRGTPHQNVAGHQGVEVRGWTSAVETPWLIWCTGCGSRLLDRAAYPGWVVDAMTRFQCALQVHVYKLGDSTRCVLNPEC